MTELPYAIGFVRASRIAVQTVRMAIDNVIGDSDLTTADRYTLAVHVHAACAAIGPTAPESVFYRAGKSAAAKMLAACFPAERLAACRLNGDHRRAY